jgi:hypothetical protein
MDKGESLVSLRMIAMWRPTAGVSAFARKGEVVPFKSVGVSLRLDVF